LQPGNQKKPRAGWPGLISAMQEPSVSRHARDKRAGPQPDTKKLVDGLETIRNYDVGLGTLISFSQSEYQGSHKVWGTQRDDHGHYQPIDLQ
jgi:hypothetical protein